MITRFYGVVPADLHRWGALRWYHYAKANNKPAEALASIILNRMLERSCCWCLAWGSGCLIDVLPTVPMRWCYAQSARCEHPGLCAGIQ